MSYKKKTLFARGFKKKWPVSDHTYAFNTPIFETSNFIISSPAKANEIIARGGNTYFEGDDYIYSRGGNPTQRVLEKSISMLEGTPDAITYSSGMAAITNLFLTVLESGDHVVCGDPVFGDTQYLFDKIGKKFGIECTFIDTSNIKELKENIQENTKLIFFETPSNPNLSVTDIRLVSKLAKKNEIMVAVDNTMATPYLQNPFLLGADVVVHSLTKFLGGHSDSLGGAICTDKNLLSKLRQTLFVTGSILDPFAAWNLSKGVKTLPIRIEQQSKSALRIAKELRKNPKIRKVYYPGLKSHSTHQTAKKQMNGFGSIISFELQKNDPKKVGIFVKNLNLFSFGVSFGGVESLVEYVPYLTHHKVTYKTESPMNLVRLSVGIEDEKDLLHDLEVSLEKI